MTDTGRELRHVREQRAERDDELDAERLGESSTTWPQNSRQRYDGSGPGEEIPGRARRRARE